LTAAAQSKHDVIIYFKDGHVIKGRLFELPKGGIFDSASGRYFPLMSGEFLIEDGLRNIKFNPGQILKVDQLKEGQVPPVQRVMRMDEPRIERPVPNHWALDRLGEWDEKGERLAHFKTLKTEPRLKQRIFG